VLVTVFAGGIADPGQYRVDTRKCIARARRITSSSTASSSTNVTVLRVDGVAVVAGRLYRICTTPLLAASTVGTDVVGATIRVSSTGTAVVGSTELQAAAATAARTMPIATWYAPTADEELSILLSVLRISGSGNCSIASGANVPIDLLVFDDGPDPGNIGASL
jgi:hypothetical protein